MEYNYSCDFSFTSGSKTYQFDSLWVKFKNGEIIEAYLLSSEQKIFISIIISRNPLNYIYFSRSMKNDSEKIFQIAKIMDQVIVFLNNKD